LGLQRKENQAEKASKTIPFRIKKQLILVKK
jgi:hypothetical protein